MLRAPNNALNIFVSTMFAFVAFSFAQVATNLHAFDASEKPTDKIANSKQGKVDYLTRVKPVLASRCIACHGALKQEGSFCDWIRQRPLKREATAGRQSNLAKVRKVFDRSDYRQRFGHANAD